MMTSFAKKYLFAALLITLLVMGLSCKLDPDPGPTDPCATPPSAVFTPDKTSGNAPLTVSFDNNSTGATTYLWTFTSSGATSTLAEPSYTFTTAASFNVSLIASSASGCKDTFEVSITVNPAGPIPVAAFTITNAGCTGPCQVIFTNNSSDATTFEWDFGDGSPVVNLVSPTHTYALPGDYFVKLTASGPGGSDMETRTLLINAPKFTKTFGGANYDLGEDVQQTIEGGYILVGTTESEGAGSSDVYLIKTDKSGNLTWKNTFGGVLYDYGNSVQQTGDGGFILAGFTDSEGAGTFDLYLIKTNNGGIESWHRTFGGFSLDLGYEVQQTSDGGYILIGATFSEGNGEDDIYLLKMNNTGTETWHKTFGGAAEDSGSSVQQTADGGYILVGSTASEGAGSYDIYLIKTDNVGDLVWKKTFGGTELDYGNSVQQTADGGYILACSGDGNLIKTNNVGDLTWEKLLGGPNVAAQDVQQTADGGYIMVGNIDSGAGDPDVYLIKTDNAGVLVWEKTFGGGGFDFGYSVQQTMDGGYILIGSTNSQGAGNSDVYLIKTDKDGNAQ